MRTTGPPPPSQIHDCGAVGRGGIELAIKRQRSVVVYLNYIASSVLRETERRETRLREIELFLQTQFNRGSSSFNMALFARVGDSVFDMEIA